jgi:hypothetical protein
MARFVASLHIALNSSGTSLWDTTSSAKLITVRTHVWSPRMCSRASSHNRASIDAVSRGSWSVTACSHLVAGTGSDTAGVVAARPV